MLFHTSNENNILWQICVMRTLTEDSPSRPTPLLGTVFPACSPIRRLPQPHRNLLRGQSLENQPFSRVFSISVHGARAPERSCMTSWKSVLTLTGIVGFAFVSLNVPGHLLNFFPEMPESLSAMLVIGSPIKSIVALLSLLFLSIGVIPTGDPQFHRGDFLQTVSLGCAIVVAACLALAIHFTSTSGPVLPGLTLSVAVIQAGVGIFAALVLTLDQRTRSLSKFPLTVNVGLCALALVYSSGLWV